MDRQHAVPAQGGQSTRRRLDQSSGDGHVAGVHLPDGFDALAAGSVWAALVMAVTYGLAWVLDRHAERVVRR